MVKLVVSLASCLLLLASSTSLAAAFFAPRTAFVAPPATTHSSSSSASAATTITTTTTTKRSSRLVFQATVVDDDVTEELDHDEATTKKKTPIILLAGFLGTGKTTALKHLLENTDGAKLGVIVNDVASVNIDAKLVSSMPESFSENMIELQNGCACCSLSDELFTSVETLFQPKISSSTTNSKNNNKKRAYDAIIVELSGVADPMAIAATWKAAAGTDRHPATNIAEISKIVTMIDACTFGTDYMTWDAVAQRPGWVESADDCAGHRKVAELLAEQVEAANLILINKCDMANEEEIEVSSKVVRALNDRAAVHQVEFGKIRPQEILEKGTTGVKTGPMENVKVEEEVEETQKKEIKETSSSSHSHGHDHDASACEDPDCTDESHEHSHSHDHDASAACDDPACTDDSHSHSHEHSADSASSCIDPGCTEDHEHSHSHATSTDNLGIVNFVYKAARPFSTNRLMALLHTWPVPVKDTLDIQVLNDAQENGYDMVDGKVEQESPFVGVLRSKGFCWMAPTKWSGPAEDAYRHDTAMYWSHAGKHFGLAANGKWWGSIQLYDGWEKYMQKMFKDNMAEYERILREDFVSEEFGDRRQELVFIGTKLDKDEITKALDKCLLTDEELETYRQNLKNYQDLVLTAVGGKGLFDVDGGVEHTES